MSNDPGNEAASSLAFATQLQQGMAQPEQSQGDSLNTPQKPETTPEQEQKPKPAEDMTKQFDDFKKEIKQDIKSELSQVKDMIKSALEEDDQKD